MSVLVQVRSLVPVRALRGSSKGLCLWGEESGRPRLHHGGCSRSLLAAHEPLASCPPGAPGNHGEQLARGSWVQPAVPQPAAV